MLDVVSELIANEDPPGAEAFVKNWQRCGVCGRVASISKDEGERSWKAQGNALAMKDNGCASRILPKNVIGIEIVVFGNDAGFYRHDALKRINQMKCLAETL